MADFADSIFNQRAAEKLRSPDDLDKYVRVINPSVWVVMAACVALLIGLLIWGIFGAVTTSVSTTGVVVKDQAMCFLDAEDAAKVHKGDAAKVGSANMTVSDVTPVPLSYYEAYLVLDSDYLTETLLKDSSWSYQVSFEGDISELEQGVPVTVYITTERVAPITLILGD